MSAITTHVLDTSRGCPAAGVPVFLFGHLAENAEVAWSPLGHGVTDEDGRVRTLLAAGAPLLAGVYRLVFETAAYFAVSGTVSFYPRVTVDFDIAPASVGGGGRHVHVPLLLSPFGFTTYRGT